MTTGDGYRLAWQAGYPQNAARRVREWDMSAEAGPHERITVLLVEDHDSYRQALEAVMAGTEDLRVVAQTGRADEAGALAGEHRPQVAVIDLDLVGGTGVTALADVRAASPDTATAVLSALTDDVEFGRAIEAGAAAVLHKSVDIPELLDALRVVARGGIALSPEDTSRRLRALAADREQHWHARLLTEHLTQRELEVLERLAQGADHHQIAREFRISPETVQTHIRNLHAKLGVRSRLEAVVKAVRLGIVPPPR